MKVGEKFLTCLTWAVALIVIVHGKRQKRDTHVTWNDCGGPDKVLHIESLSISPMPVKLPGVMRITYNAHSSDTISNAALLLTIKRDTFLGDIRIPCIFNIGSCIYEDMCTLLDRMEAEDWAGISNQIANQIRGLFDSANINYHCPVQATQMNVRDYPFQMPELPTILSIFADGNYKVNFKIVDRVSHQQLGCFNVNLSIKKQETSGWFFRKRR